MRLQKTVLHRAILGSLGGLALSLPLAVNAATTDERPPEWPVATKDLARVSDNQPITISVLDNDIGGGLTLTSVNEWSTNGGKARINDDGKTITYNKLGSPDTWPDVDSFWYVFTDAWGRKNAAKVEIILGEPANQGWPVSIRDNANTTINTPITIDVLANDTGLGLSLKEVNGSSVKWGSIIIQGDKALYTPYKDFTGTDEFWYVMTNVLGQTNAAKVTVNVTEPTVVESNRLNDTGVTLCGDYPIDNSGQHNHDLTSCSGVDAQGDPIPPNQDATTGRDVTDNNGNDGHAGFSFTKLSATGESLASSATTWSCVKDNVTGLIWENKAGLSLGRGVAGLHSADDEFTYYNTDTTQNGGVTSGTERHLSFPDRCYGYVADKPETYCNTQAFVKRVNTEGYCGISNWRLPNTPELASLLNYDGRSPSIETAYFPNTAYSTYATSSLSVRSDNHLKAIAFYDAHIQTTPKGSQSAIRLVSKPSENLAVTVINQSE